MTKSSVKWSGEEAALAPLIRGVSLSRLHANCPLGGRGHVLKAICFSTIKECLASSLVLRERRESVSLSHGPFLGQSSGRC